MKHALRIIIRTKDFPRHLRSIFGRLTISLFIRNRVNHIINRAQDFVRQFLSTEYFTPENRFACYMFGTAAALIGVIWIAISIQVAAEKEVTYRSVSQQTMNLSHLFESSATSTALEMDRILHYLRSTFVRNGYKADWPALVRAEFTANKRSVQIAVIDAEGMMITSSKMLHPTKKIDLSFREHYTVHAKAQKDQLFISKPLIGKASKKWSVQFTRPFFLEDGAFGGVLVISLDPTYLMREYKQVDLGPAGGLALVGNDDIFRAGSGRYLTSLGKTVTQGNIGAPMQNSTDNNMMDREYRTSGATVTFARQSKDFPFRVITTRDGTAALSGWRIKRLRYYFGATILTALILFASVVGVVKRHRYEVDLKSMARFDSLTKLSNRMVFINRLNTLLDARQKGKIFNVALVDLDHFKTINDTHGHPTADAVLIQVAQRILGIVRSGDLVARLGGDEFAIIQENCNDEVSASALALRLCTTLREPYLIDGTFIESGASVGVVRGAETFSDDDTIMRAADLALYDAKLAGRGDFRIFEQQMTEAANARLAIEKGLRAALQNDEFEIHYQPIVRISDRKISGVEALVRWAHPTKGMISPGVFIPVAEQTGLINQIGPWVLEQSCKDIAGHSDHLSLAVNVSAIEFRDTDVAATVRRALEMSDLAPSRLRIEITESLLLRNDNSTLTQLEAIKNLGIMIAMDDFGTGYSSLSYLHKYPIDQIKIDQSFVNGIGEVEHAAAIIKTIVKLAECMTIKTVAEGIETEEQLSIITEAGCDKAQGYLFSRPVPLSEIPKNPMIYARKKPALVVAA